MRPSVRLQALPSSLLLLLSATLLTPACAYDPANPPVGQDGLNIEVTKQVTCSRPTRNGDDISVHYRGTLESNGKEFDASYNRGTPFTFKLGAGQVIKGWDKGLLDMCVGEGRRLTIPPSLGYGDFGVGSIPAGSTLVFETELEDIKGVPKKTSQATPTSNVVATSGVATSVPATSVPDDKASDPKPTEGSDSGPKGQKDEDDKSNGDCRLLGPFAILVQAALGALALLSLVFKRWRERPRRPLKVWSFDVSKQVVGSILLHLANLAMSMFSSGNFDAASTAKELSSAAQAEDGSQPNPCSFYLLNLAIDTTIGIPVLVILLRLLHIAFKQTPLANPPESIKSGNYGEPPRWTWWLKQSLIYFIGLFGMKLFVFFLFQILPWIAWVGDWALRWTEGNEALQIAFVMFIFPVLMNGIQYYIIDSFIKQKDTGDREGFERVPSEDSQGDEHERRTSEESVPESVEEGGKGVSATTKEHLAEANPTALPAYDSQADGSGSGTSASSTIKEDDAHR